LVTYHHIYIYITQTFPSQARASIPNYWITFGAKLHNIEQISPTIDSRWGIKYKCNNCSTITDKFVVITREITVQNKTGRGEVNLDFSCKSCKRNNKVTIVSPPEGVDYPSISSKDEDPKAILGLSIHGSAEPIEVDVENSGPWQALITVKGKKVTESFAFSVPNSNEQDNEQQSYDSGDEDYTVKSKLPIYRWYKEVSEDVYYRVDKLHVEIFTDKQLPDAHRPRGDGGEAHTEDEEEKGKGGKGGKGGKAPRGGRKK